MEQLNSLHEREQESLNRHNFISTCLQTGKPEVTKKVAQAIMEAWIWLEKEGFLAPKPGTQGEWRYITKRGKRFKNHSDVEAYRKANLLPQRMIHEQIIEKVWSAFIRGDYDTAVFQAFREIEIAVRMLGGFAPEDIGVDLMRRAFHPEKGPLTDKSRPVAEREALSNLFVGAIGYYKNPVSHRDFAITDPLEGVEMIFLASHLMRILDSRVVASSPMN